MSEFIAIEGGDGSGKGTQTELLRAHAADVLGINVLKLSFPRYGEPSAHYAEQYLNGAYGSAEDVPPELGSLVFMPDRVVETPKINHRLSLPNSLVLSDRYVASNMAHQGAKIDDPIKRKAFYERTMEMEYRVLRIPRPTLNIVLLVPAALAQENVDKKDASTRSYTTLKRDIHEADASHLEKAKRNFEELCDYYPEEYVPIYCANEEGAMRPIEDIFHEMLRIANLPTA